MIKKFIANLDYRLECEDSGFVRTSFVITMLVLVFLVSALTFILLAEIPKIFITAVIGVFIGRVIYAGVTGK